MKKTPIIITLILSATILIMFYSYHFHLADYAKCIGVEKFKIEHRDESQKIVDEVLNNGDEGVLNDAKEYCLRKTK